MSNKLINEVVSTSIKTDAIPSSTDDVVLNYENKLSKSIANKILSASKTGITPTFTNEEMSYLAKKAEEESYLSEVKVITPDPVITLKKGSTEINIKNAATLVKKMEEIYPTPNKSEEFVEVTNDHWVKKSTPKHVVDSDPDFTPAGISIVSPEVKPVNKNAYEIRADILSQALAWVQYKGERSNTSSFSPSDEEVLNTAQKFYKFVENRR